MIKKEIRYLGSQCHSKVDIHFDTFDLRPSSQEGLVISKSQPSAPGHLNVITEAYTEFKTVSMGLWVFSGSRAELQPQNFGISHFIEHMLFKGTKRRTALQIVQDLESKGGELNAFTDREMTCYHATVLNKDVPLALELLSDMLLESTFSPHELERERHVILQELASVEDNPEEFSFDLFFDHFWKKSSLGHPILGTKKSISTLQSNHLSQWHFESLCRAPIVLSLAGAVDISSMRQNLSQYLVPGLRQNLKKHSIRPALSNDPVVAPLKGTLFCERDYEQTQMIVGFPGLPYAHPKRAALFLLNSWLGGGMSSRLFQRIREEMGVAYSVYSQIASLTDQGIFFVSVGTDPSRVQDVKVALDEEMDRLTQHAISHDQLQMAKERFIGALWMQADSLESRMMSLARNQVAFGEYISVEQVAREVESVTTEDILHCAQTYLNPEKACHVIVGAKESIAGFSDVQHSDGSHLFE